MGDGNHDDFARLDCVDDVEWKATSQSATKPVLSPKPASGSGHCLITWNGWHFAPAIGVISTAGFLEPELFHPRIFDRIELVDENASQSRLFLAGKSPDSFLEVVELAAHIQIIGTASCDC